MYADHLRNGLSVGQRRRVAVARALANDPALILADEPTGDLDTKTGIAIMNLLSELNDGVQRLSWLHTTPHLSTYADRTVEIKHARDER